MQIHFVSSLAAEDEGRLAPQMLAAIAEVLDGLPVSYSIRIETTAGSAIHHNHTAAAFHRPPPEPASLVPESVAPLRLAKS
jgi:hypothetical protein